MSFALVESGPNAGQGKPRVLAGLLLVSFEDCQQPGHGRFLSGCYPLNPCVPLTFTGPGQASKFVPK